MAILAREIVVVQFLVLIELFEVFSILFLSFCPYIILQDLLVEVTVFQLPHHIIQSACDALNLDRVD